VLDPESPYVAYCPPGTIEDAQETLDRGGHIYSKIYEHQILTDTEQIILIDTTPIELNASSYHPAEHWFRAAAMERYLSGPLIPRHVITPVCPLINRSTD
jgi:hypothetical protein